MNDKTYSIQTEYIINYTNKKPVPIPEIIETLKSIENMIHRTPVFLEHKYKGISIVQVEVYIDTLQAGSLKERFIIKYIFKGQENFDNAKKVIDKVIEDNQVIKTMVAMSIGAMVTYGVMKSMEHSTAPTTHIEAHNNTIINIGAEMDINVKDLTAILKATKDKKALVKDSINIIQPAKADPNATIEMSGIKALTMDKHFISEAPDEYVLPEPEEEETDYSNADVLIYASDRDKADSNWGGIVPGLVDKRIQFTLADDVDPAKLHGRTKIKADITLHKKFNRSKKRFEPNYVEIRLVN